MLPCQDYGGYRGFGYIRKDGKVHIGQDLNCPLDSYVHAVFPGKIIFSDEVNGFGGANAKGGVIIIEHEIKNVIYTSLYGHIKKFFTVNIERGQGDLVGLIADYVTEGLHLPHLHFCIHVGAGIPTGKWGYIDVDLSKYTVRDNYVIDDYIDGWLNPINFIVNQREV